MEILTAGNKKKADELRKKIRIFECHLCGCRWSADKTEYTIEYDWQNGRNVYKSVCPCCGEVAADFSSEL